MTFWNSLRHRFASHAINQPDPNTYPLREYVASMTVQLARLARADGDRRLAEALEDAAEIARTLGKEDA